MGVAEEYEEMEEYSRQLEQMKRQVSNLTDALAKLHTGHQVAEAETDADCMSEGCSQPIDWYCKHCKFFICTKCSKRPCANERNHELTDFEEMFSNCKDKYTEWKMGNEATLGALTEQKQKLTEEITTEMEKLSRASPDELLSREMAQIASELPAKTKLLQDITKRIEDLVSSLSSSGVSIESLSQIKFIRVFNELDFNSLLSEIIDLDRISLSDTSVWVTKKTQYDLDVTPNGDVLVGGNDGFDIYNKDGQVIRSVPVNESDITSIQYYKGRVYTLIKEPGEGSKRRVVVFDTPSYTECVRWELPDYVYMGMLAVSNDKVYVANCHSKRVKIYSLTGSPISEFCHFALKKPVHINSCPPDGVLLADWAAGIVCKIDSVTDNIAWQFDVKNPKGVCCDHLNNLWVWSRDEKAFVVRSCDGKQVKRFTHLGILDGGIGYINGLAMVDGYLWGAAKDKGLIRIKVNIARVPQTKTDAYESS